MVNDQIVNYLITWLCYGNEQAAKRVAYTADEKALKDYDVIIIPCGYLGKEIIVPELKRPEVEQPAKGKSIIRTDILYNTFFFSSRAEELVHTKKDEHGRFAARFSMLNQKSRLQIPRLDEYARLLLKQLGEPLPTPGFGHIYLTHDVDVIAQYHQLRSAVGAVLHGKAKEVCRSLTNIHRDPYYTFPWLIEQDAQVPQAEPIYFIKDTRGKGYDYPQYCLKGCDYRALKRLLLDSGAQIGLHGSYYGLTGKARFPLHRSHFLRCSIEQMEHLVKAGVTDDFSMGFADQAGFRLQTSRAIRWINPRTYELTPLTLHPLLIMDCTLSNANYMNLDEDEAYFLCERLIDKVRLHHGDLCLLWHNSLFTEDSYHRSLYPKILNLIYGK